MSELLKKLIIRIHKNAQDHRITLCVTRATKLVYLVEWQYFAWMQKRLTSLDWIFLHYGPWSQELSTIFQKGFSSPPEEEVPGGFHPVYWKFPEFKYVDTRLTYELEGIVERVFDAFGSATTQEIIDYVYSNTEPMQNAQRGETLDFTKTKKPFIPFNPAERVEKEIKEELRNRIKKATQVKLEEQREIMGELEPKLLEELNKFDAAQGKIRIPEGIEVLIDADNKQSIAEEG